MADERSLRTSLSAQASVLSELVAARFEPELVRAGINFSTFELLSAAHAADGKASQAELARRLGITAPSLCESIKQAVARELVEQRPYGRDRRVHRVQLTRKGGAVLRKVLIALAEIEDSLVAGLEPKRVEEAVALLQLAARNLEDLA